MATTDQDEYSILTPEYISTLTDAQKTTYSNQILSTISGVDIELVADDLDIVNSQNQLSTDTVIASLGQSTLDASLLAFSISDNEYRITSTNLVSSINAEIYASTFVSTITSLADISGVLINNSISTMTSEYELASTFIAAQNEGGISTLAAISAQQADYDTSLAIFYAASTVSVEADKDFIKYSTIYTSTMAVSDSLTDVVKTATNEYTVATSTLQGYNDEYITINIDYLNKQAETDQASIELDVATMNLSSALVYQTLSHLNADNINLSIQLQETLALLPESMRGGGAAEDMANKALANTLQTQLTSTVNALSSLGTYASSLSMQAQEKAIIALGISSDLYTSSINNYSSLAAAANEDINSIISTQVSYLQQAAIYDAQVLSTQKGMPSIVTLEAQQKSTILSYTTQLEQERSTLSVAYLTYSSQTLLAASFADQVNSYTSSAQGYLIFLTSIDSQIAAYTVAKQSSITAIQTMNTQLVSSQTAYTANDTLYKTKKRAQTRAAADTSLYDSQAFVSQIQSQEGEYLYKQAKSRFYRMPADTAFVATKALYDTAVQDISSGTITTNTYESAFAVATSTLIAWNTSIASYDAALQEISTFTPLCVDYAAKVAARVNAQKALITAQESLDISSTTEDAVAGANQALTDATAAEAAVKTSLTLQKQQVNVAIAVADSSWIGLMAPADAAAIESTIAYYR
jgi:hypothetical protein